jgi:hypothetical protein
MVFASLCSIFEDFVPRGLPVIGRLDIFLTMQKLARLLLMMFRPCIEAQIKGPLAWQVVH